MCQQCLRKYSSLFCCNLSMPAALACRHRKTATVVNSSVDTARKTSNGGINSARSTSSWLTGHSTVELDQATAVSGQLCMQKPHREPTAECAPHQHVSQSTHLSAIKGASLATGEAALVMMLQSPILMPHCRPPSEVSSLQLTKFAAE
eukprot:GHUV01004740.1.p1 GENE.GHUV01004740.1~~GHUV01004740.1.p1  ORF type:complete len:148 (-),score=34.66 GHUV01004740.1:589-1032(-)